MVESRGSTKALDGLDLLTAHQLVKELAFLDEAIKEGLNEYGNYFTGSGVGATLYVRRKAAKARLKEIPNIIAELSEARGVTNFDKIGAFLFNCLFNGLALYGLFKFLSDIANK